MLWIDHVNNNLGHLVHGIVNQYIANLRYALLLEELYKKRFRPCESPSTIKITNFFIELVCRSHHFVSCTIMHSPKQGAYGKIKIHKEPLLLSMLLHPDEVFYTILAAGWKYQQQRRCLSKDMIQEKFPQREQDLTFCMDMLEQVSRSFSTVIRQLPNDLMVDVMIFYLVLRALDTIEDDTVTLGDNQLRTKIHLLKTFHRHALLEPPPTTTATATNSWHGIGQGHEQRLLQEFSRVQSIFSCLGDGSKLIITDITKRMGQGMAEMAAKNLTQGTATIEEYNTYCHYVAGLVGEGLSRLFAQSQLEEPNLAQQLYLSDQMGAFLQKTNIIRDYLEDYVECRAFWPRTIWKKYTKVETPDLGYFAANPTSHAAQQCLCEMITDALEHVPACLAYLSELQCQPIFRFCAIPQVMAMATLAKCFGNQRVFTGVVKIRKGLSCKLMMRSVTLDGVHEIFYQQAKWIERKAIQRYRHQQYRYHHGTTEQDAVLLNALLDACDVICAITEPAYQRRQQAKLLPMVLVSVIVIFQFLPNVTLLLVVGMAFWNYCFGPFQMVTNPFHCVQPTLWLSRAWNDATAKQNSGR